MFNLREREPNNVEESKSLFFHLCSYFFLRLSLALEKR